MHFYTSSLAPRLRLSHIGSNSSRKRKAYSIEKKLEAIDYAKKFKSKKAASDKFGISRSTVQDWVKQEEELRVMSKNSKRLAGLDGTSHLQSSMLNGSEDDQIHCFQKDGSVPTGRVKLQRARNDKELAELLEEIDLEEEQGMLVMIVMFHSIVDKIVGIVNKECLFESAKFHSLSS
uniref:HTH psq-type domain-containing protein n=1 Tax=Ditylenchus dipsaci TaxID=166011 RepID=A0A915CQH2_9BILA